MTKTSPAFAAEELDVDTILDHLNTRKRELAIGAIVVAAIAGGFLLWKMSSNQKLDRAQQALTDATNALYAGNRPLAAVQLQTVADRYKDTPAGVEGAMVLAQLNFEDAKWADGVKILEGIKSSGAAKNFQAPIDALMGGAYADMKKYDDAAKSYQAAADETEYQPGKDVYSADEARVLSLAGKKDAARKIWESLASKPESPAVAEAKIRLGELDAAPAAKN